MNETYSLVRVSGARGDRECIIATYYEHANEHPHYSMRDHAIRDAQTLTKAGLRLRLYGPDGTVKF